MLGRRFLIVIVNVLGLDAAVMPGTQVGRNRGIAAERQRCGNQQNDQDSGNASHAENPITGASSQTGAARRSSRSGTHRRAVVQRLLCREVTASAAEPS